jgi:hypothetical protein
VNFKFSLPGGNFDFSNPKTFSTGFVLLFVKVREFIFSDLLGAVCLLNFARRTAHEFPAFGFIPTRWKGGIFHFTTNIKKIVARYHPLWLRLLFEKQKDQTKVEKTEKV